MRQVLSLKLFLHTSFASLLYTIMMIWHITVFGTKTLLVRPYARMLIQHLLIFVSLIMYNNANLAPNISTKTQYLQTSRTKSSPFCEQTLNWSTHKLAFSYFLYKQSPVSDIIHIILSQFYQTITYFIFQVTIYQQSHNFKST